MNICSKTSRFRIALIKNLFRKSELVRFYVGKYIQLINYSEMHISQQVNRSNCAFGQDRLQNYNQPFIPRTVKNKIVNFSQYKIVHKIL